MTLCRRDFHFALVILVLVLLWLGSILARPAEGSALDQVAAEVASKVAGDLAGNNLVDMLSNLTLAGVLWFFSRQFYIDNKATNLQVLQIAKDYASLAERIANALDNLSAGKTSTGRFPRDREHDHGHNAD